MSGDYIQHGLSNGETRCEFERTLRGESCPENREVELDGLRVCERHADRLRLEEQAAYCRAILAHVALWSGEARRRGRRDVVGLLEFERARVSASLGRANEELEKSREGGGENGGDGEDGPGGGGRLLWPPLLLLGVAVTG